jgi:hypothetical protein
VSIIGRIHLPVKKYLTLITFYPEHCRGNVLFQTAFSGKDGLKRPYPRISAKAAEFHKKIEI